jgi:hypothetical protein
MKLTTLKEVPMVDCGKQHQHKGRLISILLMGQTYRLFGLGLAALTIITVYAKLITMVPFIMIMQITLVASVLQFISISRL